MKSKSTKTVSLSAAKQVKDAKPAKPVAAAKPALSKEHMDRLRDEAHAEVAALSARSCACGCGTPTKSTFAPGHDARLFSAKLKAKVEEALAALAVADLNAKPVKQVRAARAAKRSSR